MDAEGNDSKDITNKTHKVLFLFFEIFNVVFAIDYGYSYRPGQRCSSKYFTVLKCVFISATLIALLCVVEKSPAIHEILLTFGSIVQYILICSVLAFNINSSFCTFQKALFSIDSKLHVDSYSYKVECKMIICFTICIFYQAILISIASFLKNLDLSKNQEPNSVAMLVRMVSCFIIVSSLSITSAVYFFVFYSVYRRLKALQTFLKVGGEREVKQCYIIYKRLVDALEMGKKPFDFLYVIFLLYHIPDIILATYLMVLFLMNWETNEGVLEFFFRLFFCAFNFIQINSTAVCAGFVSSAVSQLRDIIDYRILQDRNQLYTVDLERFLAYVDARPMQYRVMGIFPMDFSQPAVILNMSVAYQIIILQFTKLR